MTTKKRPAVTDELRAFADRQHRALLEVHTSQVRLVEELRHELSLFDGDAGEEAHHVEGSGAGPLGLLVTRDRTMARLVEAESVLVDLQAALGRFATNRYGRCDRCGGDIGVHRLEALPTATLCLRCAQDTGGT